MSDESKTKDKGKEKKVTFKDKGKEAASSSKPEVESEIEPEVEGEPVDDVSISYSRNLHLWMVKTKCSIIISAYNLHWLLTLGTNQETQKLQFWVTNILRPMGLGMSDDQLTFTSSSLNTFNQYSREKKEEAAPLSVGPEGEDQIEPGVFDVNFYPRKMYITGDLNIHDTAINEEGQVFFVSVPFNSILTPSDNKSFKAYWTPPWIEKRDDGTLPEEDRCHLNGMAMFNGKPRWVTAHSQLNDFNSWRDHPDEGVLYDIVDEKVVVKGLSSPHSPRWYKNKLWMLQSGKGEFGYVDLKKGKFVSKCFIPGFLRGMDFIGDIAVVGSSYDRFDNTFDKIPLGDILKEKGTESKCGLWFIDIKTCEIRHYLEFSKDCKVKEIYDMKFIKNCRRGRVLALDASEIGATFHQ